MCKAKSRGVLVAVLAATIGCWAGQAKAGHVSIVPTDFDTLDLGTQVRADLLSHFTTNSGVDIGDLVGSVHFNSASGVYTYVLKLTPGINNISEFNTGFDVNGFTGVAGYSFSEALAAGGAFEIEHESDGTIDWNSVGIQDGSKFFDAGETITFFFQSTLPPATLDVYSLINSRAGGTLNYAPVIPAPAALPAGLALLGLVAAARRRFV